MMDREGLVNLIASDCISAGLTANCEGVAQYVIAASEVSLSDATIALMMFTPTVLLICAWVVAVLLTEFLFLVFDSLAFAKRSIERWFGA